VKTINPLCASNTVFVKYQAQGGVWTLNFAPCLRPWSASIRGTPTKLSMSFSRLNTWLADSEHELVSFLPLLQACFSWRTPFLLALYTYRLIHFSSHSSDYHGTRNSNYRRNNTYCNALRNKCSVSTSYYSMYEAVSLNDVMTHESQRL